VLGMPYLTKRMQYHARNGYSIENVYVYKVKPNLHDSAQQSNSRK